MKEISRHQILELELATEVDLRIKVEIEGDKLRLRNETIEAYSTRLQLDKRDLEDIEDSLHQENARAQRLYAHEITHRDQWIMGLGQQLVNLGQIPCLPPLL